VGVVVNLSVWRDADALLDFVYTHRHRAVLRNPALPQTRTEVAARDHR
jgi:hypothetical protein